MKPGFWIADCGFWSACGANHGVRLQGLFAGDEHYRKKMRRYPVGSWSGHSIQNLKSKIKNHAAFSLVEVTLAIGIVSFALLAVMALLPIGLKTVKNSNEQAGAANVLNAIAEATRSTRSSDGTNFSGTFSGQAINFQIGDLTTNQTTWTNLTLEGGEETQLSPKRLSAVLRIKPSLDILLPSRATISVAWSAQANPQWDADSQTWTRAEGSLTSGLQFLPKQ